MASVGTVVRGDYEEITFTVTNPNGSARDITSDTIRFSAKDRLEASVALVTKVSTNAGEITKTNAASGQGKVILQPADLSAVTKDGQTLHCDIVVTDSSGKPYTTRFELTAMLDVSA